MTYLHMYIVTTETIERVPLYREDFTPLQSEVFNLSRVRTYLGIRQAVKGPEMASIAKPI